LSIAFSPITVPAAGNRILEKRGSAREVLRTLKTGGIVGIRPISTLRAEAGVFCDFFGVQACTTTSLATLALRTGAVVFRLHRLGRKDAHHRLYGEQAGRNNCDGDFEADVRSTLRVIQVIESIIRRHPDQWLWIHRRWRTRPDKSGKYIESAWSN